MAQARDSKGRFTALTTQPPYDPGKVNERPVATFVKYLLDESSSMQQHYAQVLSGSKEYIQNLKQKLQNESVVYFSLTRFGTYGHSTLRMTSPYIAVPVASVPDTIDFAPNGNTPLYDAIGQSIIEVDTVIRERSLKVDRILHIIHTDGEENMSRTYTLNAIRSLIEQREGTGFWTFVFMGSEPSAWHVGQSMGISIGNISKYDPQQMNVAFAAAASATMDYRKSSDRQVKTFFSAGTKVTDGATIQAERREEFISSDGYTRYTATRWQDGTLSCNCPGWSNRKDCRHIKEMIAKYGGVSAIRTKATV